MRNGRFLAVLTLVFALLAASPGFAGEKATPKEVYDMILNAANVLETLGDEGLDAFNDSKGEFVWKDSYVFIIDCSKMKIVAHPKKKRIGADLSNNMDKNPDPSKRKMHNREMCELAKNPMGGWVDYYWGKLGDAKPTRKIGFIIQVPGTPYSATAGIYNDAVDVADLNRQLQ